MDIFYSSYNARHLEPKQVAQTFIWSDSFRKLIQNNHSVILGARGCGKTTLMKMLTLPALYNWKDAQASEVRSNIPFYAIYISTDIYWNVKNNTYGAQLKKFGSLAEAVSHFAVNTNVFTSLCDTFMNILTFEVVGTQEQEVELCIELIKAWKLEAVIPQLQFVREALIRRIDEVNQLIQGLIFNYQEGEPIPNPIYFSLNFESSIELIIPIFERIYSIDSNSDRKKWALCFDELEFAPDWLKERLFESLRSRKQYILYKLSSSPILSVSVQKSVAGAYAPSVDNDVQLIKMWASVDAEEFSRKIIQSFVGDQSSLKDCFGSNDLYNKSHDSYQEGSEFFTALQELIKKDDSFRSFLKSKGVDPSDPLPSNISKASKDVLYRKIKPVVLFRNTFIESNRLGKFTKYRSRKKAPELYHGIEVLSKICDGNPRWLIGVVNQLMAGSNGGKISKELQYDVLTATAKRFQAVVANLPVGESSLTVIDLLGRIGEYFRWQVLGEQFRMDPKGTFEVDESDVDVQNNVIELIDSGVSQGAFILLDADDESYDFEIRGRRFKLSYLFSILFDLPLRAYPKARLSECLADLGNGDAKQISLFN